MTFEEISEWVSIHETLITLVLLPAVFFILTHWIAGRSDKRAARDRAAQREVDKQIALAEIKVGASRELRRDLGELISGFRSFRLSGVPSHGAITGTYHKVLLQLELHGEYFEKFVELSEFLLKAPDFPEFQKSLEEMKILAVRVINERDGEILSELIESGSAQ